MTPITSALISVYYKDGLEPLVQLLHQQNVKLYSTGGTQSFIENLGIPVTAVEDLTGYPSIFGGRVKTLHPSVMGGILYRRNLPEDVAQAERHRIPPIDLVIVDLYPFEETVASGASDEDIIEKIDIGGISLIRAAAKNYNDVLIVSSRSQYADVVTLLTEKAGATDLSDRRRYARDAFAVTSHYDTAIQRISRPTNRRMMLYNQPQRWQPAKPTRPCMIFASCQPRTCATAKIRTSRRRSASGRGRLMRTPDIHQSPRQ